MVVVKAMAQYDFAQVYADHKETVWKLVSRYVFSQQDREDLFQEVFLRIHQGLSKFEGRSGIETWIYRIAVNTSLNFLKKRKRYAALKDILGKLRFIEQNEEQNEEEKELSKLLGKLNPQQRMILIMADVEEKKLEEIAQSLGLPLGTVKSNLHRAREIVKKEMNRNEGI
jgi:RNA polymerase sigma-70 factor (ECF subfamily)